MRIGFISADWADFNTGSPGGCTWIRCESVAHYLNAIGHEAACGEIGWKDGEGFVVVPTNLRLSQNGRHPIQNPQVCFDRLDVVIIKLFMWHEAKELIEKAREYGQVVIIDIDDWFLGLPITNIAFETTHPNRDPLWNRDHMHTSYSAADALIHSTEFLADNYGRFNKNNYIVRNSVSPHLFLKRYDNAGWKPTIGWVGIMLWRQHDVEKLKGILGPFLDEHDLMFYHAGMLMDKPKQFAELTKMNPERLIEVTGTNVHNYGNILLPMDIGLVPLDMVPFNEAKSSLKGVEYAMSGIPFIANATNEYKILNNDGAGKVVVKPRDWIKHLEYYLDPANRKADAQKGFEVVMEKYNLETKVHEWSDTIIEIYKKAKGI
jgi:glycosyltransferase involved in cell wall biosynthesis